MSGSSNDDKRPSRVLDHLFIGSRVHAKNRGLLKELGINRILNVTPARTMDPSNGVPNFFEKDRSMTYKRVAVFDNRGEDLLQHFESCISFIEQGSFYGKVLVHCNKGVSRSSTVVAAYLMRTRGLSKAAALTYLRSRRSIVNPHEGFTAQLEAFETKLVREREAAIADGQAKKFPDDLLDTGGRGKPQGPSIGPIGPSRGPPAPTPASNNSPTRRRPAVGPSPPRTSGATGITAGASRIGPAAAGKGGLSASPPRRAPAGPPIGPSRGPPGPERPPAEPSAKSSSGADWVARGAAGAPQSGKLEARGTKGGRAKAVECLAATAGAERRSASKSPLGGGVSGSVGEAAVDAVGTAAPAVIGPAVGPPTSADHAVAGEQTLDDGNAVKDSSAERRPAGEIEKGTVGVIGPAIGPYPGPMVAESQSSKSGSAGDGTCGDSGTVKAIDIGGKRARDGEASAGDHSDAVAQKARVAVGGEEDRIR